MDTNIHKYPCTSVRTHKYVNMPCPYIYTHTYMRKWHVQTFTQIPVCIHLHTLTYISKSKLCTHSALKKPRPLSLAKQAQHQCSRQSGGVHSSKRFIPRQNVSSWRHGGRRWRRHAHRAACMGGNDEGIWRTMRWYFAVYENASLHRSLIFSFLLF